MEPGWIWFLSFVSFRTQSQLDGAFLQVIQIAQGLEYLHGQSIVHGDLRGVSTLLRDNYQLFHPFSSQTC